MDFKISAPVVLAIILLIVTVSGELVILGSDHDDFSSSATVDGDMISVKTDTNGSHVVNAISMSDSYETPKNVFIYFDNSYQSTYNSVRVAVGARPLTEENYARMLIETLNVRDISCASMVNASEMKVLMETSGDGIAIVVLSGALPDVVYDGTADSKVLKWISSGGRLYWAGGVIGNYVSHHDSVEKVQNGVSLFFGSECIDETVTDSFDKYYDNALTESLSIINNNVRYSPRVSELPEDLSYQVFGYTDGERYSSFIGKYGSGCICIVGGDYSDYQRIDMAQIIASGISPETIVEDTYEGDSPSTIELKKGETVYVYYGGDLTVYGKLHEVA